MRTQALAVVESVGVARILRRLLVSRREVTILTFHRVSDERDDLWPPMPVQVFERMMGVLAREAKVVPVESLSAVDSYPDKPLVCLSFDDGYMDFFENALPIIRRYGLPCHHNVCPGLIDSGAMAWTQVVSKSLQRHVGRRLHLPDGSHFDVPGRIEEADFLAVLARLYGMKHSIRSAFVAELSDALGGAQRNYLMGWDQIRACQAAEVRIGSHGMWHNHLPTIEDEATLREEIVDSRRRIFEETGVTPDIFAFPSGFYDERSLSLVQAAGYRVALLCEDRRFRHPPGAADACSVYPRINMAGGSFHEERLRALGFHQHVKRWLWRPRRTLASGQRPDEQADVQ